MWTTRKTYCKKNTFYMGNCSMLLYASESNKKRTSVYMVNLVLTGMQLHRMLYLGYTVLSHECVVPATQYSAEGHDV